MNKCETRGIYKPHTNCPYLTRNGLRRIALGEAVAHKLYFREVTVGRKGRCEVDLGNVGCERSDSFILKYLYPEIVEVVQTPKIRASFEYLFFNRYSNGIKI